MIRLTLLLSTLLGNMCTLQAQPSNATGDIPEAVVKKVDPSVVAIHHERATGSGFIISKDGYLLSNGHVVSGSNSDDPTEPAKAITVVLNDETKYSATVLGFSLNPDVALLKIEPRTPLTPVEFADVSDVKIGQPCFAVGTPHGLKRTFSRGILSNVDRTDLSTFTKVYQTDAAINPGNSGGPLFNRDGKVLGLNTYASRGANNLGFTIPINYALVMKDHFKEHGRFIRADWPTFFAGELYDEMQQALGIERGLIVHYVKEGTKIYEAGLRMGDVITHIDDSPISARNRAELLEIDWDITVRPPGEKITFTILRGAPGKTEEMTITGHLIEAEPPMTTSRFKGEIRTSRIDALGLAYKPIVTMHRLFYNLTDTPGALVTKPGAASAALRAGLTSEDIITEVEGESVEGIDSLETALLTHLRAGLKAIDLTISRGSYAFPTALKPYYRLKDERVLVVVPKGISEQFARIIRELTADGAQVTIAAPNGKTDNPTPDGLAPALKLDSVDIADVDRVLLVEGDGAEKLYQIEAVKNLLKAAGKAGIIIAAEGAAALAIPAADETLRENKVTTRRDLSALAGSLGAQYTGQDVELDGKILTSAGDGEPTTREFLKKFRDMR